mmetsp:Transcript_2817/g.8222  ORF Transcript_2817/g.8222 Transcript_2817/m.8222 type:complete len:114 (+) Transcript_2817:1011-1352(+)
MFSESPRYAILLVTEPLTEEDVFWMHEPDAEYQHAMNLACFRLASDPDTPGSGVGYAGDPDPPFYRAYLDAPDSESDSASDSEEQEAAVSGDEDEGDESDSEPDEVATLLASI